MDNKDSKKTLEELVVENNIFLKKIDDKLWAVNIMAWLGIIGFIFGIASILFGVFK